MEVTSVWPLLCLSQPFADVVTHAAVGHWERAAVIRLHSGFSDFETCWKRLYPTHCFIHSSIYSKEKHIKAPNRKMYEHNISHTTFSFNIYLVYCNMFSLCFVLLFLNKLFHQQDFSCLEVNYAHSSLTYLMAGLSRGPTRRNWKVCHH